jgi:hypothetical protein
MRTQFGSTCWEIPDYFHSGSELLYTSHRDQYAGFRGIV